MLNKLPKRRKFVIGSLLLTFILLLTELSNSAIRFPMILFFSFVAYFLSFLALSEDIKGIEFLTLFILPVAFSFSVSLFYFLLPVRWLTRLPFSLLYGVLIYAILLSENIFNVTAIRTIQLYQAALAVCSFISILTFFLLSNIIFSFHLASFFNFFLFLLISFIILLKNLWNISLENYLEKRLVKITFFLALIIAEIAFILSFWPVVPLILSLFLTTLFYLLLGITQTYLLKKPLGSLILEYFLFLFTLLVLFWRGAWGN